jgi:hypothetical protein
MKAKATLVAGLQTADDGSLKVHAKLTPADAEPLLLTDNGGRMQLTAALSKVTSTCYGDTIFEDDFDADGF